MGGLSNDLVKQFAKLTKSEKNTKTESTHNGTVVVYNGNQYVQVDGSDLLTPVNTTADIKDGDRVTVMIKNHSATVTGNATSPSARTGDVQELSTEVGKYSSRITEVEILVADKVSTEELEAESARIDELVADNIIVRETVTANTVIVEEIKAENVVISERLDAVDAFIENLDTEFLTAEMADIRYATIEDLEATNADIYNLEAVYGDFEDFATKKFTAYDATIDNLDATYATIIDLNAEKARIDDLEANRLTANSAVIKDLQVDVADINTLIFGSATGDVIQTSFANAVIAQLGNAQIKSAMIESVSADKITAGDIITNNVRVMSEDGKLLISDETIQISDETRVRVQIGKDSAGDYSINIWDAAGNLMFSEGGITDSTIKEAIIRDDMVSDTANISAHKLNIESLFEEINGSAQTIKSSKIMMDGEGQTLDVIFTDMTTDMTVINETVKTQGTQLSVIQGDITSKVWKQDITAAIDNIEVGGRNLFGFHKGIGIAPVLSTVSTTEKNEPTYGVSATVIADYSGNLLRISHIGLNVIDLGKEPFTFSAIAYASIDNCAIRMDMCDTESHPFVISATPKKISFTAYPSSYCTEDDAYYNGFVDLAGDNLPIGTVIYLEKIKIERGTVATDFTVAPEDLEYITDNLETKTNTLTTQYSSLDQTVDGISVTVANHTSELAEKADETDVVAIEDNVAKLTLTVNDFKTEVSATYATKGALEGVNEQVLVNKSAIEQNTDEITLRATKTEVNNAINNIDVGGRNLLLGTTAIMSFPETEEFVSYNKYMTYKFSPIVSNDVKKFLLDLRNGEALTVSFDINLPRVYKDGSLTLSRLGAYTAFTFTRSDGTKLNWYGTHSAEPIKTNRHTIENFGVNSLNQLSDTETSLIGRYSCYITPGSSPYSVLKNFYENPDDYTVTSGGLSVEFGGFTTGGYLANFKMELGNKATDWAPAPEDLETRVSNAEAQLIVNSDNIASVVSRTTDNEKAISTLQQTSSSLTSRIKTTEDDIKTNTSLIINAQSDIDDLEVGARNLARNTSNEISYTVTTETGTDAYSKCDSYVAHGIFLEQGQTYTLSYNYEFDWGSVTKPTDAAGIGAGIGSDDGQNLPGSYFKDSFAMMADYWLYGDGGYDSGRFVYTFTNDKGKDLYLAFRMIRSYHSTNVTDITGVTLTVSNFKVEKGNCATDWTPAPEDMATADQLASVQSSVGLTEERVSTAESLIQQLSTSISMLVTDGNGESLMVQTEDGWTFSTGELQNIVDTTSENLDSLTNEVGDVSSTVGLLQQAVDDLGVLNDYVKITTYEEEPCIELGENDSDFKLLITNTRIMFMEGSTVPAYINNQSLFIKKAVIEEELEQGQFIWKARSNGNLGLIWKGATN